MAGSQAFDASEMSISELITRISAKQCPFVAIPVFPSRCFRHGFIAVNRRTVRAPKDLAGKRIGVPLYTQTAAVFMRGLLAEDYGVDFSGVHWIEGAINQAAPHGHPTVLPVLRPVSITANDTGRSLSDLIAAGEIDAILGTSLPASIKTSPDVVRLFPDFREREKDYYRRTRIFPIMHAVAIRRDVHAAHPFVAQSLYAALCAAKDARARADALPRRVALHAALADGRHRRDRRGVRRRSLALRDRAEPADTRGGDPLSARSVADRGAARRRGRVRAAARRVPVLAITCDSFAAKVGRVIRPRQIKVEPGGFGPPKRWILLPSSVMKSPGR